MPAALALVALTLLAQSGEIPPLVPAGSAFGVLLLSIGLIWRVVRGINKTYKADVGELRRRLATSDRRNLMLTELVGQLAAQGVIEVPAGFWERYWREEPHD